MECRGVRSQGVVDVFPRRRSGLGHPLAEAAVVERLEPPSSRRPPPRLQIDGTCGAGGRRRRHPPAMDAAPHFSPRTADEWHV